MFRDYRFQSIIVIHLSFLVASEAPWNARYREGSVKRKNKGSFRTAISRTEGNALTLLRVGKECALLLQIIHLVSVLSFIGNIGKVFGGRKAKK